MYIDPKPHLHTLNVAYKDKQLTCFQFLQNKKFVAAALDRMINYPRIKKIVHIFSIITASKAYFWTYQAPMSTI